MPEQERARLKEQYIKEFRERRHIRRTLEAARRRKAANQALSDMVDALEDPADPTDEFTSRLDAETAMNEARLEIALENQIPEDLRQSDPESPAPSQASTTDSTAKTIGPRLRTDPSE